MLIRTLLAPWRRIVSLGGGSLDARIRAALDNLVSRCVGFAVRILVLIGATLAILLTLALSIALVIIWPLLPLAFIYFIVRGITG
jgi:hypothetical protein